MTVQPFEIRIEPAVLDDLRDRLRRTRWPDEIDGAGWDYGMTGSVLRSFVQTWLEEFDWPTQQFGSTSTRIFGSTSTGSRARHPARSSQLRRPTTVSHQTLIDPAKTRRAVQRMKERVPADAASTAGRLAPGFST